MSSHQILIVLGNLMNELGEVNQITVKRLETAMLLEERNAHTMIIVCGWAYRQESTISLAQAMKMYISAHHPAVEMKVVCQDQSRDTVGDAVFSRIYIESQGMVGNARLKVVTSDYHVERSREIFRFVYGNYVKLSIIGTAECERKQSPDQIELLHQESASLETFRRTFEGIQAGQLKEIYGRMRAIHPYYNGEIFAKLRPLSGSYLMFE